MPTTDAGAIGKSFSFTQAGQLTCNDSTSEVAVGEDCVGAVKLTFTAGAAESVTVTSVTDPGIAVSFAPGGVEAPRWVFTPSPNAVGEVGLRIRFRGVAAAGPATILLRAVSNTLGTIEIPIRLTVRSRAGFALVSVRSGGRFACGLDSNGDAWCWGDNSAGQFGNGTTSSSTLPVKVGGGHRFSSLHPQDSHACGLDMAGTLWCWGTERTRAFGTGTALTQPALMPVTSAGARVFSKVAIGSLSGCGVTAGGELWCWGGSGLNLTNVYLGNGVLGGSPTPINVSGGRVWKDVSGGNGHNCGLTTSGLVYCWGFNSYGEVGDGTSTNRPSPTAIASPLMFDSVTVGASLSCALTSSGAAWCWGSNNLGQLGAGASGLSSLIPLEVSGNIRFKKLEVSRNGGGVCGIDTTDAIWCWGPAEVRETSSADYARVPRPLPGMLTFSHVSTGSPVSCGVSTNGLTAVYCWVPGSNQGSYLGTGGTRDYIGPVPVARPDGS